MLFPRVTGSNLLRQRLILPQDFQGDLNVLVIAFQQWHQARVNTWLPFLKELEIIHTGIRYYELPTIFRMNIISQFLINEGMRAGIPDHMARERTVTLYIEKTEFFEQLEIPNEEDIQIRLVDRDGFVYGKSSGIYTLEKADYLVNSIKEANLLGLLSKV